MHKGLISNCTLGLALWEASDIREDVLPSFLNDKNYIERKMFSSELCHLSPSQSLS